MTSTSTAPSDNQPQQTRSSASVGAKRPAAARAVLHALSAWRHGALDIHLPDGSLTRLGTAGAADSAVLHVDNWATFGAALRSGDIGFAESYIAGHWTTPDLSALLKVLLANRDGIENLVYGNWWGSLLYRLRHLLHRNSRAGSKKNIHAHYDIGNDFYRLWLDDSMSYSSAWFRGDLAGDLRQAQDAKLQRALQQCALQPGSRLLDIGCGWGALSEHAAREFGADVTGITLSTEQLNWARAHLEHVGIRADLRLQDYRDLPRNGPADGFDAITSIEMFEAVGQEYWPAYFETIAHQLRPGGLACIQTITIREANFERYLRSTDFIQQYIFPGGVLPSPTAFRAAAEQAGLGVVGEFAFGLDYAETLKRWRERFMAQLDQVHALGFDTRFVRIWEFYLAYCEAAFATGNTDVIQFTLKRP